MAKVSFTKQPTSYTTDKVAQLVAERFQGEGEVIRLAATWENETILLLADSTDMVVINLEDAQPVFSLSDDRLTDLISNTDNPSADREHFIMRAFVESYIIDNPIGLLWYPVELVACELRYI